MPFIPDKVREVREALGKDRDEFAKILGVSTQTIINAEEGKHLPNVSLINKIEDKFNANPAVFFSH